MSTRQIAKGKLGDVTFQLNPTTMNYDNGNIWAETNSPGMKIPIQSFSYGKPPTITFELWVNVKHQSPLDIADMFNKLHKYRNGKEPVLFVYGSFVGKYIIKECPFDIQAWTNKLRIMEMYVPITLVHSGEF